MQEFAPGVCDARLPPALVDRLVHHAHVPAFTGESYRLQHALSEVKSS
ncbi:ATP-binding protein [Alicyclobacillus contaminans]|nr:ATP-binding protein [Alicyclobacillus contaminans]